MKIKSLRNGKIILSLSVKVNHVIIANICVAKMSFNSFCENKILAKISELHTAIRQQEHKQSCNQSSVYQEDKLRKTTKDTKNYISKQAPGV